jgi:hypothetical protein
MPFETSSYASMIEFRFYQESKLEISDVPKIEEFKE